MRKLICWLAGHKWKRMLFTQVCLRCAKADIMDETMDQFVPNWRSRLPFMERHFGGHISFFNHRITIYGWNAMHLAINIRMGRRFICFHPTIKMFGVWWPWYLYSSHDGTPCSATWGFGPGFNR